MTIMCQSQSNTPSSAEFIRQNLGKKPNKLYFEMFIHFYWQQANELKSIHFINYTSYYVSYAIYAKTMLFYLC